MADEKRVTHTTETTTEQTTVVHEERPPEPEPRKPETVVIETHTEA